ncbi:MAG: RtcB family protein [Candidatus Margulisiibacteriota bacterium]
MKTSHTFERISDYLWQVPKTFQAGMRVPARVYSSEEMLNAIVEDGAWLQVVNMSFLPGIVDYALAMPDVHYGYGFPIGGVAAFDPEEGGIVSPGGVGYDINCGVRLLETQLSFEDLRPRLRDLLYKLASYVPAGLGSKGLEKVSGHDLNSILENGASWAVKQGMGEPEDLEHTEERGCIVTAQPDCVSANAKESGRPQLGSLGSGNHFLEIQRVETVYDPITAAKFGLFEGQITVMVHCGSRKLGYNVCEEYVRLMKRNLTKYNLVLPDQQLACAPLNSSEGQQYLAAMAAAANYAWANRQVIAHNIRQAFREVLGKQAGPITQVYDVAHNIAKFENFRNKKLCIHRKGATRAYPCQPVLIPGSMGTASYVLTGTEKAMEKTFGSVCHGAGRVMSRKSALRQFSAGDIIRDLEKKNILIYAASKSGIVEEAPQVYKNIDEVVNVLEQAGLAKKVARLKPLAVIKG